MTDEQRSSFHAGTQTRAYQFMGCHRELRCGESGYLFRVWAPHAVSVRLVGSFNGWDTSAPPMTRTEDGLFEQFSPEASEGDLYKYYIETRDGRHLWKADPYAFSSGRLPETASRVCSLGGYDWKDGPYRRALARKKLHQNPIHIYEVHAGSWRRHDDGSFLSYSELAEKLIPYVKEMGYTHIELMPLCEHPYDPSWGYQVTGYFAPTSRYGSPQGLMAFVDACHQAEIGVLLDWVPAHFPRDEQGLFEFDGETCYELSDPVMRDHPQWGTRIFDYDVPEVQSFLISSAVYWLEEYHLDGLRVDAVASMLYLSFERSVWTPNPDGSAENRAAIRFLRRLNSVVSGLRSNLIMAAEESTTFPGVTTPVEEGGLGFTFKWNLGWMNDTLRYLSEDPLYRKYCHNLLTFGMTYAFSENFLLPLSHDEVVHEKRSMIEKMPGSYDDKFANLRTLYGYQISLPGKKLSFMGNEFAQFDEWSESKELDWFLLRYDRHSQMQHWVRNLNRFYLEQRPLWQNDADWNGFRWIIPDDADRSVLAYYRSDRKGKLVLVICNFCPVLREHYRIGLPKKGCYLPKLCSDYPSYGGHGVPLYTVRSEPIPSDGFPLSGEFTLPPLSVSFYLPE